MYIYIKEVDAKEVTIAGCFTQLRYIDRDEPCKTSIGSGKSAESSPRATSSEIGAPLNRNKLERRISAVLRVLAGGAEKCQANRKDRSPFARVWL